MCCPIQLYFLTNHLATVWTPTHQSKLDRANLCLDEIAEDVDKMQCIYNIISQ
jgi:hypothetical protein